MKQVSVLPFIAELQPPHHSLSAPAPGPRSIGRSVQVTVNSERGQTLAWPERCLITPRWPSHPPGVVSESLQPWAAPRLTRSQFTKRKLRPDDRNFFYFLLSPSQFLCVFASLGPSEKESWPAAKVSPVARAQSSVTLLWAPSLHPHLSHPFLPTQL